MNYLLQGLALGLAYVAPIGMQNIYVINTAISKSKLRAYQVAVITSFFDISLAIACFLGIGALLAAYDVLRLAVLCIGGLAVIYIGIQLIRCSPSVNSAVDLNKTLLQVAITCFVVTWLNPQAIIDGTLLLGGMRAAMQGTEANLFILGVCMASFSWFMIVTTLVSGFKKSFNQRIVKGINVVCGAVIIYYGGRLLYSFISSFL